MDLRQPIPYTFPDITYLADYPVVPNAECVDLELGTDIENNTIAYRGHQYWADWSGYTCAYYEEDACTNGHASEVWNSSNWGPFQFFYNGHIKNGTGRGHMKNGHNSTSLRAHAGNVCCTCGGGKNAATGKLVRPYDDYDYDLNGVEMLRDTAPSRVHKRGKPRRPFPQVLRSSSKPVVHEEFLI